MLIEQEAAAADRVFSVLLWFGPVFAEPVLLWEHEKCPRLAAMTISKRALCLVSTVLSHVYGFGTGAGAGTAIRQHDDNKTAGLMHHVSRHKALRRPRTGRSLRCTGVTI